AAFGWLWALSALGPSLNFVATAHAMQDRFFYLSLPGVLLVAVEAYMGLQRRIATAPPVLFRGAAAGFAVMLTILSISRSADFESIFTLFNDAVKRQPLSAIAH